MYYKYFPKEKAMEKATEAATFTPGDVIELTEEVRAVRQLPEGGGVTYMLSMGTRLTFVALVPGTDFLEFIHAGGSKYRLGYSTFLRPNSFWRKVSAAPLAPQVKQTNDGREYCFDASCGGKVKQVPGVISVFGVCSRCGK